MKIKYMGTSDIRVLPKGETFGGQLADGLPKELRFTPENNHVVDTEGMGLSQEATDLILGVVGVAYGEGDLLADGEESTARNVKEFKDVSDLKVIPPSVNQSTFRGVGRTKVEDIEVQADGEPDAPQTRAPGRSSAGQRSGGGSQTTTVGGSTGGTGGDTP